MKTFLICALGLALVGSVNAQIASNFSFDWQTIESTRQLDLRNINDRGDVFGYYVNPSGPKTGFIYNPNSGFQDIAITDGVEVISKLTSSGSVYSYGQSATEQAIFRTKIGGTETRIDLTNGGTISFNGPIGNVNIGDDDRMLFSDSIGRAYLWTAESGTKDLGPSTGRYTFGPSGSLIRVDRNANTVTKIAQDGTVSNIALPFGPLVYGKIAGYQETSAGAQRFTFFASSSGPFSSRSSTVSYIVPVDGSLLPNQFELTESSGGGFTLLSGLKIEAMNENGYVVTSKYENPLPQNITNLDSFDVRNSTGAVFSGAQIKTINGASGYLLGEASIPGISGTTQVYGRYTGQYAHVPEPASLAVLGLGLLALVRRRKKKG